MVSADGELLLDDPTGMDLAWVSGGCAMADLDADGHQEVVAYGMWGLRLYDLDTGESSRWEDGSAGSVRSAPTIADVDDDGIAEIVVVGGEGLDSEMQDSVYVLGPAEGRWARTRAVWNQVLYDPGMVDEDGTIGATPSGTLRAQPGRDGAYPDLVPEVLGACATDCMVGRVSVGVRVLNRGPVEAPAGSIVTLYAEDRRVIGSTVLDAPVPAGWASAGFTLDVDVDDWRAPGALEVLGASQECDAGNDRLTWGLPDPCP